jgi:hypothetical protein
MRRMLYWIGLCCLFATVPVARSAGFAIPDPLLVRALTSGDGLGARVRFRELASQRPDARTWRWLESQIIEHPEWGEDLYSMVLSKAAAGVQGLEEGPLEAQLAKADEAMLAKRHEEAVQIYRSVLGSPVAAGIGRTATNYLRMALARALYSARRFDEALAEARRIPPVFSRYRHVLFMRMWAAFRAGRVEAALGEIAAQRSKYFGEFIEPESYLLLTYLLKRLCRTEELKQVFSEIDRMSADLKSGKLDWRTWARMEVGTASYLALIDAPDPAGVDSRRLEPRKRERLWLTQLLKGSFERKRQQWLEELPKVQAYSRLATTPGLDAGLKPIEKITSREKLLAQGYEIWPAEDSEHWLDELGQQRYLGDTECGKR